MSNRDNDNSGAGEGSNKAALPINSKTSFIDQSAVVYDVLSEGEIEGLVDGAYTIYLDGTPVLDNSRKDTFSAKRSGNVSYVASTGVITDNESANMFSNLSVDDGDRFIRIDGAAGTGNVNVAVNVATVTPSSSGGLTFANTMVSNNNTTLIDMQPKIRIAGAGQDGGVHTATITSFDSSAGTVEITPPPKTTVNNAATTVDLVDQVGGISGATATISPSGQGVNRSNVACTMSSPIVSDSSAPIYNVDNFSYALRTGHRNQEFVVSPEGVGQGAIGVAIGNDLPSSSKAALGMGTETRIFANLDDHNRDTLTASSGVGESIAASQFGLADPGEIDQLKVTINHPRGLFTNDSEDGDSGNSWVELKIVFQYTRGSQTFTETIFGLDDMSTIAREKHGTRPGANGFDGTLHNGIISRKTQAQFATVFSFDTERFQPFDDFTIKVFKYTPDNYEASNKLHYNQVQVGFVEAIIEDKLNYPYSAYAAVMIDSKDYSTVPKRSYEIRGIKCKVPTNYIPRDTLDENGNRTTTASYKRNITTGAVESTYQDWDGKFRGDRKEFTDPDNVNYNPVYTNNPAWIFYDILTNERYGLGSYLNVDGALDLVDRYQLFEVAKYCDELVPDGKGGTEPRFTCNVYISKTSEAIKVLKDLLTVFRGILLWHEGEITLNLQQEKAPIYTFTKGNVVDGLFQYNYSSKRVRANQIRVTWNDPDNSYRQAVELVEDSKNIAETGRIVSKATVAYGCTSESQAHRVGKYHLLTETQDSEIVNFSSGIGGQILRPGDLIEVQDADRDNIQLSGRVSSGATTTVIPVDRSVALSSAANADLSLIYPNSGAYLTQPEATIGGTIFRQGDLILQAKNSSDSLYTITNGDAHVANARDDSGDKISLAWSEDLRIETKAISSYNTTHVVVSSAFSAVPNEEVVFAITQTTATGEKLAGSPQTYIITSISEQEGKIFSISALKHTDGKYDEIDRGWTISTVPDVMRPPKATDGVPKPKNVSMRLERGLADNGGDEKTTNAFEARIAPARLDLYWSKPDSLRQDDNGTSIQTPYEHLLHYEVSHNLYNQTAERGKTTFDTIVVSQDKTTHTFDNVPKQGKYIVRIRTVSTNGAKSPVIQRTITINPEKPAKQLEPKIRFGGALTSEMTIAPSTGLVSLTDSDYNMTPAEAEIATYIVASGTTAQTSQSFASLASGNTGYMLHDYSDATDPWKAIEYVRDTTGASTYRYAKQIGVDAFTQKTGTANTTLGSVIVDGTNTAFINEYQAGDLFIFDSGSTRHISTINHIHSNTQLEMAHGAPATATGKNVFAQSIQPNFVKDTIIGEVANTSGTFSLINYASGNRGRDSYTISLSNEAHSFPADKDGNVSASNFTAFSSSATVLKGTASQTFAASGTALNTFGMTISGSSNCTAAIDGSGNISVSAMTADTASITLAFTDRYAGISIGSKAISLTKSRAGDDGSSGSDGKRSVQGYLYYEKTTSGAPSAPGSTTYRFATGDIDGGSGATEVLALADTSAVDKWTNEPRTQDPTSSNVHWTVRYSGTETSAGSSTCTVAYSTIVQYTNFTGVVTFSGGTFKDGGTNITTIDGGNISTGTIIADALNVSTLSSIAANIGTVTSGTIKSADHAGTADGSDFSTDGTQINLSDGSISSKNFRIASDGSAAYKGTLTIGGTDLTTTNTLNSNTTATDVGLGNVDNTTDASVLSSAASAANSADKTAGTVGGWTLSASAITGGTASGAANATFATSGGIMLGSAGFISANQFYVDTDGNANFKGTISGNDAVISGTLQTSNIQLGSFGANVSGTTIGSFNENDLNYREIGTIGTGAGVYMGTIQAKGGDNHVKTIHFHVSDTTVNTSVTTSDTPVHSQSNTNGAFHQRVSANVDYLIKESRLYGTESGSTATDGLANRTFFTQPVVFKYEGTGTVKLYIYAQADGANNKKVGHIDYRFIKLGTTDPQFSFSNLTGQALSTTLYANSQVTGGFSGTKTVTISGGGAQFKIDGGSFGTSSQQISNGSYINVQMTSSSSNQTTTSTTVTIGNTSSSWSITTGGTSGNGNGDDDGGDDDNGDEDEASFVYGTNLTLSDGTTKKVEDIVVGDVLKAFKDTNLDENATNPHLSWTANTLENASHGTCTVQGISIIEADSFYIVNNRLHVTGTHYILVLRGSQYSWKQVKDLQPGDYMIKDGLTLEKIISVQPFTNNVDVYTFDTETADSYIAEGVVVYDSEI